MNDVSQQTRRAPSASITGGYSLPWLNNLGATIMKTENEALIDAGYGFHTTVGAFSTPIVGGGNGTVISALRSEFVLNVPAGIYVKVLRIAVQLNAPLLATDADEIEAVIQVDTTSVSTASASTGTTAPFVNMLTSNTNTSGCTAWKANTGNHNSPVVATELDRFSMKGDVNGVAANAMWAPAQLLYQPTHPLIINSTTGAALYVYWGGTVAVGGFMQIDFIAYPTTPSVHSALFTA